MVVVGRPARIASSSGAAWKYNSNFFSTFCGMHIVAHLCLIIHVLVLCFHFPEEKLLSDCYACHSKQKSTTKTNISLLQGVMVFTLPKVMPFSL